MLTKNELIVLYGMRTLDYEKDPNPEHWRTISGAKVHLDQNGEIDGGAGGNFNGNYWDGKKGQQHVIGPHTMMKKNIGSGATNVMLAAGGFLGNALGKTQKEPPKKESNFVFPHIMPRTKPKMDDYVKIALRKALRHAAGRGEQSIYTRAAIGVVSKYSGVPEGELTAPTIVSEIEREFGSAFAEANQERKKPFGEADIKKYQAALEAFKNADPKDREFALRGINLKTLGKDAGAAYKEWLKAASKLQSNEGGETSTGSKTSVMETNSLPNAFKVGANQKNFDKLQSLLEKYANGNSVSEPIYSKLGSIVKRYNGGKGVLDVTLTSPTNGGCCISPSAYYGMGIKIPRLSTIPDDCLPGAVDTTMHELMHAVDWSLGTGWDNPYSNQTTRPAVQNFIHALVNTSKEIGPESKKLIDEFYKEQHNLQKEVSKANRDAYDEKKRKNEELQAEIDKKYGMEKAWILDPNGYKEYQTRYKPIKAEYDKSLKDGTMRLKQGDRSLLGGGMPALFDFYSALAGGGWKNGDTDLAYGHRRVGYYDDQKMVRAEMIANYGVLTLMRPRVLEALRKDKPELCKALDECMRDMQTLS